MRRWRLLPALVLALGLSGCGWFRGKPEPPASPPIQTAIPLVQSACPNAAEVWATSTYPRAAIIRGLAEGRATVRFRVDGRRVEIVDVIATDPAFGEAAAGVVQRYQCAVDRVTTFEMAFAYRRG
jgi:hypothetical protein